jgi:hypothetical protein
MCAATSFVVRPVNDTVSCNVWAAGSSTTTAVPVPIELVGGFSFEPDRLTVKVIAIP